MADWLILLLKYGGFGGVLLLALFVMGKWLVKRITAALDSYVSAYAQQSASIDARIANLEKLVEEQAKLTRTVESIKDEIAAHAKSRDNRWEFQKDVYVNIISAISRMMRALARINSGLRLVNELGREGASATDLRMTSATQRLNAALDEHRVSSDTFGKYLSLSFLAIAEEVAPLVVATWNTFEHSDLSTPESIVANMPAKQAALGELLGKLQAAGRKDLWGESEPKAEVQA
jgi:hypothetical protein